MMRPVILSRPEKLAFLLVIFVAGGSETTSSPGCRLAEAGGTPPLGWRWPGGNPGRGLDAGGALATPGAAGPPGCGGVTAIPGWGFRGTPVVPGGGAKGGGWP